MRKHKTLVHAPVIEDYLLGQDNERIEYLELPGDPEKYSIDEDIKKGAVQFTELRGLISRRRISRVITLTSETVEMGLIAVTYAAMEVLKRNKDLLDPEENEIYADGWNDSIRNVPIIQFSEIISHMSNDSMSYADRGFMMAQEQVGKKRVPYWERCRRNPVCIVVKPNFANPGYIDYLNMFSGNKHVYVLFVESERDKQQNEEEFFMYDGMDSQHFTALRNNFILTNTSDYADISFGESDGKEYYTSVFKENITRRGLSVEKNFSYSRVIDLATSINKDNVCMMIDKIISYSVKDIEDKTRYKLKNSDFDFADHFMRIKSPIENEGNGRELMEKNLVGIEDIKEQVYDVVNVMKYNKIRRSMNISGSNYHNVHVMLGAPGTAKTTVARYMGQMMFNEKLLPDNRFICINGAELKGMYVGHSAPKTKALFNSYDVIIIDEAYSIVETGGGTDSFGNEAIAQLIIELEKHSTDKLVVFAGYGGDVNEQDNRMQAFLDSNPGIKSRITSTFYFRSYSSDEMTAIFERIAQNSNYRLEEGARELINDFFAGRSKMRDFGNGREARVLLETAVIFAAKRVMGQQKDHYTPDEMKLLTIEDIKAAIKKTEEGFGSKQAGSSKKIIGF